MGRSDDARRIPRIVFQAVEVPAENLLGDGQRFDCKEHAFGQANRLVPEFTAPAGGNNGVGGIWPLVHIDRCIVLQAGKTLNAEEAAMAKWWCGDLACRVIGRSSGCTAASGCMLDRQVLSRSRRSEPRRLLGV